TGLNPAARRLASWRPQTRAAPPRPCRSTTGSWAALLPMRQILGQGCPIEKSQRPAWQQEVLLSPQASRSVEPRPVGARRRAAGNGAAVDGTVGPPARVGVRSPPAQVGDNRRKEREGLLGFRCR